jgi:hypothetical protein
MVMHHDDLQALSRHFPFNLISLENLVGTINDFQILLEGITAAERVNKVKAYFVTQLETDKSLYQGFVSSHRKERLDLDGMIVCLLNT